MFWGLYYKILCICNISKTSLLKMRKKNCLLILTYDVALFKPIGNSANLGSFSKSYCKAVANHIQQCSGVFTIKYYAFAMKGKWLVFILSVTKALVPLTNILAYYRICTFQNGFIVQASGLMYYMWLNVRVIWLVTILQTVAVCKS